MCYKSVAKIYIIFETAKKKRIKYDFEAFLCE